MKVLYSLVCEDAQVRPDGRMDVHAVFHELLAPGFPAQQDQLVLVAVLEWEEGESGTQRFSIDLVDPSDSPCGTLNVETDVLPRGARMAPPRTPLVFPIEGAVFPSAGSYTFVLRLGEREQRLAGLHLLHDPSVRPD
ncbi:MAG: hypothetical protein AVDCRST_MAG89-862 [uncultured Gemmatimonadetes bacterium]|uniref:Uncharacterized protein n=1 Tax=uncultured Gemmatimonadota bacterium TaxID=203437 RepID=A0A6J4KI91_9BACT|nr:MAG: hypothetical protein AVDCRST_MAG89-862 [uncultured Gemmatimonadota bacterium]